jgi:glycine betaine/proline transport system ATP-binding protein
MQTQRPPAARLKQVDIVFSDQPKAALAMLDAGHSRQEILAATGAVVGAAACSLDFAEGEISVLMGLSGSGKSTLLRCLNGLNRATRGEVLIRDDAGAQDYTDIAQCDDRTLRRLRTTRIAMVFQQFALLPWRTVAENVGLGLELSGVPRAKRERVVAQQLELVGLQAWGSKYAHELSGGMQQRVGLARAFATDADILLMDEPFSALDPLIREHLQRELLALQRTLKKTIVFVSHDLDEALKLGNRISIMDAGRIVQSDVPEQIVLKPANDYVRAFVAHMNPIKVLRGASVMTPLSSLAASGDMLRLDWSGHHHLRCNATGVPELAMVGTEVARLLAFDEPPDPAALGSSVPVVAMVPASMLLEHIIRIRHVTGRPVLVCEGARLLGVVGDTEIYRAMLGERVALV